MFNRQRVSLGPDAFVGTVILGMVSCIGGGLIFGLVVEGKYSGRDWMIYFVAAVVYTLSLSVELKQVFYGSYPFTLDVLGSVFEAFGFKQFGKGNRLLIIVVR
jgi:hypothetical protein